MNHLSLLSNKFLDILEFFFQNFLTLQNFFFFFKNEREHESTNFGHVFLAASDIALKEFRSDSTKHFAAIAFTIVKKRISEK